jgi:hypothetical protein
MALMTLSNDSLFLFTQEPTGFADHESETEAQYESFRKMVSSRAWVMQELVLARVTVHFSANQIYWECGKGIHYENLTRLER